MLMYSAPDRTMMAVSVAITANSVSLEKPAGLFRALADAGGWGRCGSRLAIPAGTEVPGEGTHRLFARGALLAVVGIYGVLASSVLERRFEIGIRMALGADSTSVVKLVLRRTMLLAAVGALLGLCGAVALSGILQSLLFNVTPTDGPTFLIATVVVMGAAFAAALIPARRTRSIDPLVALRAE